MVRTTFSGYWATAGAAVQAADRNATDMHSCLFSLCMMAPVILAMGGNRNFKPPFSQSATLSPTLSPLRQAVNGAVFGENSPLSVIIGTLHRRESLTPTQFDRFARVRAERDRQPCGRTALALPIRPP